MVKIMSGKLNSIAYNNQQWRYDNSTNIQFKEKRNDMRQDRASLMKLKKTELVDIMMSKGKCRSAKEEQEFAQKVLRMGENPCELCDHFKTALRTRHHCSRCEACHKYRNFKRV